jgi:membrane-associated phospholipid phosphatase
VTISSPFFAPLLPVVLFLTIWLLCWLPFKRLVKGGKVETKRVSAWFARRRIVKWFLGHSGSPGKYGPVLLLMVLGALAAVVAGFLFVMLAEQVERSTSWVSHADRAVHTWFGNERRPGLTTLFNTATDIGGTIGLGAIVALVAGTLFARKERASAAFVLATGAAGALLNLGLKAIYARMRPDAVSALVSATWYSFPSGHAMDSFIIFGTLVYIALRQPWPWIWKSACIALGATMVLVISVSRVYLGVHWASDIVGGWSAATAWLFFAMLAFEMQLRQREKRRGPRRAGIKGEVPDKPVRARRPHPAHQH